MTVYRYVRLRASWRMSARVILNGKAKAFIAGAVVKASTSSATSRWE